MSDTDNKCERGSEAHAMFRRADAEHRKAEESAEWRKLAREFIDWLKTRFSKE